MNDVLPVYVALQKAFNEKKFSGFPDISMGYVLSFPLSHILIGKKAGFLSTVKSLMNCIFTDRIAFEADFSGAPILFVLTHQYLQRKDHMDTMEKIAGTTVCRDYLKPVNTAKFRIHLDRIRFLHKWRREIRGIHITRAEKRYLLLHILSAHNYIETVEQYVDFKKYKCVVVRMDGQIYDNVIAQTAHNNGCTTVTIQDGYEIPLCQKAFYFWQVQAKLRGSISDYCLAWSRYFAELIAQAVPVKQQVIAAGMPKYITEVEVSEPNEKTEFGILLDSCRIDNSNEEMIRIANRICNVYNISYVLRYHPADRTDYYDALVEGNGRAESVENRSELNDFAKNCLFVIGCNSSAILESAVINKRTYRMLPQRGTDLLSKCEYPVCFSDFVSLRDSLENKAEIEEEYVEKVCGPAHPMEEYRKFFQTFFTEK